MIYNFEPLSFQILAIMRLNHPKGVFEVKKRPYAAISFKLSGSVDFEVKGEKLFTKEKNIVYIPANVDYKADYHEKNDSIIIHFVNCNYKHPENIVVENKAHIELLFFNLLNAYKKNCSINQAKSYIYDILFHLSMSNLKNSNKIFEDITEYMKKYYYDTEMSISTICNCFYISRSTIQTLFKELTGVSPKQYLTNIRMESALLLLAENNTSIKDIALSCGFSDEKYFSRVFKKKYGCPPSQFADYIAF